MSSEVELFLVKFFNTPHAPCPFTSQLLTVQLRSKCVLLVAAAPDSLLQNYFMIFSVSTSIDSTFSCDLSASYHMAQEDG